MDVDALRQQVDKLPATEKAEALKLLLKIEDMRDKQRAQEHFLPFVQRMWPDFIFGTHHKIMADAFDRVANGELKRLIINMPPRHTKSMFSSYLFPAWFLGRYPKKKVIQASHTGELAVGFGRQVRNLINSDEYHEVFEDVTISADSKAAGRWNTNKGGTYFATGVGGTMTGIGADILMIDDPHSEQDAQQGAGNPDVYHRVYEWYTSGPRQRLQPGGAIIVIQTRWSKIDLTGQLISRQINGTSGDEWEVIELPAILPSGKALWPEYWELEELEKLKQSLPVGKWMAQYQQNPTSEEGAIIKREWWKRWDKSRPPHIEALIMSWDTAFLKTERSDYSAMTLWGIFYHPDDTGKDQPNLMLIYAWSEKVEFPELKRVAHQMYVEYEPDQFVVEKRASGAPLIFELRAMGIPVTEFTPSRGQDKISRANAVSDLFASGFVWAPQTRWAEEVIEQCASFPNGDHDDYVDSTTQALIRFRQGGWLRTNMDEDDEEEYAPQTYEYY